MPIFSSVPLPGSPPVPAVPGVSTVGGGDPAQVVRAGVSSADGSPIATVSRRLRPAGPNEPGPEVVVVVQGDIDLDTAPLAQATLLQALEDAERVCLDLSEVQFFGADGIRVVVTARRHAAARGRTLRLSGVHGIAERVLTLTGLCPAD